MTDADKPEEAQSDDRIEVYADEWANRPLFALDADVTVYWPAVRPCYEETQ